MYVSADQQRGLSPEFLKTVSLQPGVYLMRDAASIIIYIGKANHLRKRLASYLRQTDSTSSKTAIMLSQVVDIETILTTTEKEALILEASLIKKYRPKYNIILRDDKNYPLIKITLDEEWPRLCTVRKRSRDKSRYFGPYSSSSAMWKTIRSLNKLFPLRRCKGKKIKKRQRPCLNYQMKRCLAPCSREVGKEEYNQYVREIILVLDGRNKELINELTVEMQSASRNLDFEKAAEFRDKIFALEKTIEKQVVVASHHKDQDVFGFTRKEASVALAVLHIKRGVVNGHHTFFVANPIGEDDSVLTEFLERFYGDEETSIIPQEILLPFSIAARDLLAEWLTEQKGGNVICRVPSRGNDRKLLGMAEKNAWQVFEERDKKQQTWNVLAQGIVNSLGLIRLPERIICLDISHTGGHQSVGAVVSFFHGEKESRSFRIYKIKSVKGPDDYGAMSELVERHLNKSAMENLLPDLLVVDGGKGQLNIAVSIVQQLKRGCQVEVVAIAKEKAEEGEKLYRPGRKNPIILKPHSPVLLFFMKIRDEAHRFGISHHRKWRSKELMTSRLSQIPGIGPSKKEVLLKEFGSLQRIESASVEQLAAVVGIGPELALGIRHFFAGKKH